MFLNSKYLNNHISLSVGVKKVSKHLSTPLLHCQEQYLIIQFLTYKHNYLCDCY